MNVDQSHTPKSFKFYHHLEARASPQSLTHLQICTFSKSLTNYKNSYTLHLRRYWIPSWITRWTQALKGLWTPPPFKIKLLKGKILHFIYKKEWLLGKWNYSTRGHLITKNNIFFSPFLPIFISICFFQGLSFIFKRLTLAHKNTINLEVQGSWHPDK